MNILFLIDWMLGPHGGTEGQLLMLYENLDSARFRVHLFCLRETPWLQSGPYGSKITALKVNRLLSLRAVTTLFRLRKYCRENKIDIIQTYFNDAFIFGAIAGRLAGVKAIISCRRNLGPGFWNKKGLLRIFRALKFVTTHYIANSRATKESIAPYEGIAPDRISVIYNGLDLTRFERRDTDRRAQTRQSLNLAPDNLLIVMVSHIRREKNIPLFLDAARDILPRYPSVRWMLLGGGPQENEIHARIESMGLTPVVSMPGPVADVVPYLEAADIACLTSDGESFSNAIIEYMAAGLPVVATDAGGNREALEGVGFLIPPGDRALLVQHLEKLIENSDLRKNLGEKARHAALSRFSIRQMTREHEELYLKFTGK